MRVMEIQMLLPEKMNGMKRLQRKSDDESGYSDVCTNATGESRLIGGDVGAAWGGVDTDSNDRIGDGETHELVSLESSGLGAGEEA